MTITGLTIQEIADQLNLSYQTAARRIERAGIKPLTREAIFPFDTVKKIKEVKVGRPKKPATDPVPAASPTKPRK